jgi:hypothetical protein
MYKVRSLPILADDSANAVVKGLGLVEQRGASPRFRCLRYGMTISSRFASDSAVQVSEVLQRGGYA